VITAAGLRRILFRIQGTKEGAAYSAVTSFATQEDGRKDKQGL